MSRKFDESRRKAFLDALAETGNQTLAAERAKVSRSWVTLHRSGDPAFRAAIKDAVEKAKRSFVLKRVQDDGSGSGVTPPSGWGSLDGVELVVRGTNGRRVQVARSRLKQWCPRAEERFLATLAATCNVKAACAEVGLTQASAYNHRRRWPAFARRWDAAVEEGYVRLNWALLECAGNVFSAQALPPPIETPPMRPDEMLQLIHLHKHAQQGIGGRPGAPRRRAPDMARVRDSVFRLLDVLDESDALSEDDKAAAERDHARRRPA